MPSYLDPVDVALIGLDPLWAARTLNALHEALPDRRIEDHLAVLPAFEGLEPGRAAVVVCGPLVDPADRVTLDTLAAQAAARPELSLVVALDDPTGPLADASRALANAEAVDAGEPDPVLAAVTRALDAPRPGPPTGADQAPTATSGWDLTGLRLVVLTATKGGVGTTTLAVHLARALAGVDDDRSPRVAVVDAHKTLGDVALVAGRPPARHEERDEYPIDADSVAHLTQIDPGTGVAVVVPPTTGTDLDPLAPAQLVALLAALEPSTDVVVVDAPLALAHDADLVAAAGAVLLVTTGHVASLKNTLIAVAIVGRADQVRVVLNDTVPRAHNPDTAAIEESLGVPVAAELPFDDDLGDPAAGPAQPGTGYRRAVARLARDLWHDDLAASGPPGRS